MSNPSESAPFCLSIAARKNSLTKHAAHVWDYDPASCLLSQRSEHSNKPGRQIEVAAFKTLIIGEDVRGTTPDGEEVWLGELKAFTLNEAGIAIQGFHLP